MSLIGFRAQNHQQQTSVRGARDEVDDRETDPRVFEQLDERFRFTLDVAANHHNAKTERYFTREDNGLEQSWSGERVWCNPPYSDCGAWVRKAWLEWDGPDPMFITDEGGYTRINPAFNPPPRPELIVMLLPANRTEQAWWQDMVEPLRDRPGHGLRVEFLRGRIRFLNPGEQQIKPNSRPPFGCCLLVWGRTS